MSGNFNALAQRAALLSAEAVDVEPVPRAMMFLCAALIAMGEDSVFHSKDFREETKRSLGGILGKAMGQEAFVERATRTKLVASVLQAKLDETCFQLCRVEEIWK